MSVAPSRAPSAGLPAEKSPAPTTTPHPGRPSPEPMPGDLMTARQRFNLVLVLGSLIAIGPLTIDMYLPALPAIAADLQTTSAAVQLTLTGTLAGLALGQLLIGPLSDARRAGAGRCSPA